MNLRHIFLLGVVGLALSVALAGQASARPLTKSPVVSQLSTTPDLVERWVQRQPAAAPDLVERFVQRQPASAYFTAAALRASGLRMQAMARMYERQSASVGSSSGSFDVRDALIGAAGGVGIAICAAGLLFAAARSRRPQLSV
jgi:hypothetical protein